MKPLLIDIDFPYCPAKIKAADIQHFITFSDNNDILF